ncbi:Bug family tripartite tricarboxylate transporter substrate binding protein [Modicisalibacter radicis]|uniref:Bug family tripartite tricarboxylate transporter substrate binding protein n=1 Tax=Halomonas sp. EAR18 TaxID=2518972 RepID=UPI00109C3253|nr:tripartite tricarboxylate transporter substrate binding protein [Halomonas sp. EAR18]
MRKVINLAASALLVTGLVPSIAEAQWPERPVNIVVPSGAGGGTDQTGRMLAEHLQERFGQPFNVINQGQGGGVVGISSIKNAAPDGYTLGILYNFAHYAPMGQAEIDAADFTPLAQFNFDPAGFQVREDSPWEDIHQALEAIKQSPGDYVIACGGGCGGSWPMAVATMMDSYGVDVSKVRFVSGKGAAAALQDLAAGGVDVVPSSLPEAAPLIQAGRIKALVVMGEDRLETFPEVPTLNEATDMDLQLGAWRGLVAPKGLPDDIAERLENAMQEIVHDDQWRQQMTDRGFGIQWRNAEAFSDFIADEQSSVRKLIDTIGLVKND